jgi:hypothetical protein
LLSVGCGLFLLSTEQERGIAECADEAESSTEL